MVEKLDYFFIVTKVKDNVNKYKLKKLNILSPLEDEALQITPRIFGLSKVAKWWSKLLPQEAASRKSVVAAATFMMHEEPTKYASAIRYMKKKRAYEQYVSTPASSQAASASAPPERHPENPLTTPFTRCFALVPHDIAFGIARPSRTSNYTPGTQRVISPCICVCKLMF